MNLMTLFNEHVRTHFNHPAITMSRDNETWSYSYLNNRVCQIAYYLKENNIQKGDGVLILIPMSLELYALLLALFKLGAVAVFIDPQSSKKHISSCIKKYPLKAFVGVKKAHLLRLMNRDIREIPLKITLGKLPFTQNFYNYYDSHKFLAQNSMVEGKDPALITFTSGSTGNPKAAVRSHDFLLKQYEVLSKNMLFGLGETDISTLPVFVLANLAAGMHSIIPNVNLLKPAEVEGGVLAKDIMKYRATRFGGSPVLVKKVLPFIKNKTNLTHVYMGGGPVYPKDIHEVGRVFKDSKVYGLYGSTEAEPICHMIADSYTSEKVNMTEKGMGLYTGKPVAEIKIKIIESENLEQEKLLHLPEVKFGEIIVSGEHVLKGYLNGEGDNENKIHFKGEVWHRTGDTGYIDDNGELWLLGRYSQRIKTKEKTVYPFAIEAALYEKGYNTVVIERKGLVCLVYEGKKPDKHLLSDYGIEDTHNISSIPRDKRHNAKVDYNELKKLL